MRHGRRTNFTSDGTLLEGAKADVTPNITVEIEHDSIETSDSIEEFSDVIVWFDLDSVWIPSKA